jgi:hypothetical protein
MNHFLKILPFAVIAILALSSCEKVVGEGPIVTQERVYSDFNAVEVNITGNLTYTQGNEYKLILHAQQNILDIIQTRVDGNELIIKFRDGKNVKAHEEIDIELVTPNLNRMKLGGAANIKLEGLVEANNLELRLSGSGNIMAEELKITGELYGNLSGSGNIDVTAGEAASTKFRLSGSGNITADAVVAANSNAEISGSGNIRLQATNQLSAKISGSGSIYYRGTPQVTVQVSGSGSVRAL